MNKKSSGDKAGSNDKEVHKHAGDELTQRNVETILELEKAAKAERTPSDRVAAAIARFCGSMLFVWVHVALLAAWIIINLISGLPHFDPFPFTFLTLVVSLDAMFLSTFILIVKIMKRKSASNEITSTYRSTC